MRFIKYFVLAFFSVLFLIYLVWPFEPGSVYSFSPLPQSKRSTLSGDTVQVPNLTAFYSNSYRKFVTGYYSNEFQYHTKLPFPPLRLNYPPEDAYSLIKDQTQSTYLEEYTYPLRGSIYVNGMEPFDEATKENKYEGAVMFMQDDMPFETKTTIRFYKSPLWARIFVWFGINVSFWLISIYIKKLSKSK